MMGQDMIGSSHSINQMANTTSQFIYKETTKQHYESSDSMKNEV